MYLFFTKFQLVGPTEESQSAALA